MKKRVTLAQSQDQNKKSILKLGNNLALEKHAKLQQAKTGQPDRVEPGAVRQQSRHTAVLIHTDLFPLQIFVLI